MTGDNNVDDDVSFTIDTYVEALKQPVLNTYYTYGDLINRGEVFGHPLVYMTTLVQIGYEPLPPKLTTSIFGRPQYQLSGPFSYLRFIAKTDGFLGLWRGLKYNIFYSVSYGFIYANINQLQKEHLKIFKPLKVPNAKYQNTTNLTLSLTLETISKFASFVVAYPFHVMMVRSMAQFIGRETHYDSIFSAISDIYQTGGFLGFYAGLIPFFIGECALIYIESGLTYLLINKKTDKMVYPLIIQIFNMIARSLTYPFRIVSTVMACNGSSARSLSASAYTAPEYSNWIECWRQLWNRNEIKRGSSLLWRYQPLSSSYAFSLRPMTPIEMEISKKIR